MLWIAIFVVIVALGVVLGSSKTKGVVGEIVVKKALGANVPNKQYVINNLTITNQKGKSTQIDHILINKTGLFVIETKFFAGTIFGNDNQHYWTQVFGYGAKKFKFYSPVMQNRSHIYALSSALEVNKGFISIVVFPKAKLKVESSTHVGNVGQMKKFIDSHTEEIFSAQEVEELYNKLLNLKQANATTHKEHVKKIKSMLSDIDNNKCPRCGGDLVEREGKYGKFYGCSNYPKCRFKKKAS